MLNADSESEMLIAHHFLTMALVELILGLYRHPTLFSRFLATTVALINMAMAWEQTPEYIQTSNWAQTPGDPTNYGRCQSLSDISSGRGH